MSQKPRQSSNEITEQPLACKQCRSGRETQKLQICEPLNSIWHRNNRKEGELIFQLTLTTRCHLKADH